MTAYFYFVCVQLGIFVSSSIRC